MTITVRYFKTKNIATKAEIIEHELVKTWVLLNVDVFAQNAHSLRLTINNLNLYCK